MKINSFIKNILLLVSLAICFTTSYAQVGPVSIGSIPKNKTVKIVYDVTVANPVSPANTTQLSHQGTISGSNLLSSVLTDDPDADGTADPTITEIDLPPSVVSINRQTPAAQLTNATSVIYRITFSESVSNVDISDFTATQVNGNVAGTVASVSSSSGTTIDVTVNPVTGDGDLRLDLNGAGTGIVDGGNQDITGGFNTGQVYTFDHTIPTVTINQAAGQVDPTNTSPINFTVVFSEAVTDFTNSDVSLSGTAGATTAVATEIAPMDGTTYNVAVSGMTSDGTVIASLLAGVASDGAGNGNTASTSTDNTVTYDATQPTVTINQAAGQADPTNTTPINFTVVFSEPVANFVTGDVSFTGSTAPGVLIGTVTEIAPNNGTTFNIAVSGMTSTGTVVASISAGAASDAAGNTSAASTSTDNTVTYDNAAPTVTINQAAGQADPTSTSPINFTVVFSEAVTGFETGDVSLNGTAGATTALVTQITPMNGTTFNIAVSGMTGDGTVIATIAANVATDLAGNNNTASTSTDNSVTYDATAPTVTVNQAAGQVDPTNTSPINFTVVFSEAVNGFSSSDITLSGTAGATTAVISGSGPTYNVAVSGMASSGTVILSIGANAVTDAAGNGNTASTSTDNTVTYDVTGPSVTINQAAGQADPTSASTINFTVVFDETITGFTNSDVTLSGTAGATTSVVSEISPNDGTTFNVAVSGMTVSGTVVATISPNVATDAAGNNNTASTSTDNTVTWIACQITCPTVAPVNNAPGQCGANVTFANATTTGNCGTLTYTVNSQPVASGDFFPVGTTTVTVSSASTGQSCTFDVTVNDEQLPVITSCPANKNVNTAPGLCTASVALDATASDNCPGVQVKYYIGATEIFSPHVFDKGSTTVIVKAVDAAGNINVTPCSFTVMVTDNEAPVITYCPGNKSANTAPGLCTASVALDATALDNCPGVQVKYYIGVTEISSPYDFPKGSTTVTVKAVDAAGNMNAAPCSFTVMVTDNEPPVITYCPGNKSANTAPGQCTASVALDAAASDNCPGVQVKYYIGVTEISSPYNFPKGSTTVTVKALDAVGNMNAAPCSFTVMVTDNEAPVISYCPENKSANTAPGLCTASVALDATASDNCPGVQVKYYIGATEIFSPHVFDKGSTTVIVKAVDAAGNMNAIPCSFTVTVTDNQDPTITAPLAVNRNTGPSSCTVLVSDADLGTPTVGDNCPGVEYQRSGVPTGNLFPVGVTTITYTAMDAAGRTKIATQAVTITDNIVPVFTTSLTANPTVIWPPDHKLKDITLNYATYDACGCTPVITVTSTDPISGAMDGDKFPDWIVVNDHLVQLRAERGNGKEARVYKIRVSCTDASNNTAFQETEVRIAHNITAPVTGTPFKVGSTVTFSGVFWDKAGNKHTGQWLVDDNTTVKGTVTEPSGTKNGKLTGSYKFTSAGIYKLQMNIIDQNNVTSYCNTNEDMEAIVVVYDPNGGYTYGGGYFNSPAGALAADPAATGKANFGFTVNYFKNATLPKGETQFEFKVGDLEYNALNFEYLSVAGYKAVVRGSGKIIGGQSGIEFMLYVVDGALDGTRVDKIRLKIFNKNTGEVYYDNEPGTSDAANPKTPVGPNSAIVIGGTNAAPVTKKGKAENVNLIEEEEPLQLTAIPNPTNYQFTLQLRGGMREPVNLRVVDAAGRTVEAKNKIANNNTLQLGGTYRPGIYIVEAVQGKQKVTLKLIKLSD